MTTDIAPLASPIDALYLIHNALRAEAAGVAQRARQLGTADTLVAFAQALHQWANALEEHARIEDTYMTPLLPARPVVQDNEAEHQRLTPCFANWRRSCRRFRLGRPSPRACNAMCWVT